MQQQGDGGSRLHPGAACVYISDGPTYRHYRDISIDDTEIIARSRVQQLRVAVLGDLVRTFVVLSDAGYVREIHQNDCNDVVCFHSVEPPHFASSK